jgi:hypothetical protein
MAGLAGRHTDTNISTVQQTVLQCEPLAVLFFFAQRKGRLCGSGREPLLRLLPSRSAFVLFQFRRRPSSRGAQAPSHRPNNQRGGRKKKRDPGQMRRDKPKLTASR